ncbi:hypothetical protein ERO13_D12G078701v2, partial [Gossypium hirsutum]
ISTNLLSFCYFFKQSSLFSQSGCLGRFLSTARRTILGTSPTRTLSPIEIPNFKACNPACASAANEVAILVWITDLDANISPPSFRTTNPEADFMSCWSKAASK